MAGDWRFQGSAMRRRMGAPSSHLDAATAGPVTTGDTRDPGLTLHDQLCQDPQCAAYRERGQDA